MILLNSGKASRGVCACSFNIALAQRPHCPHWLAISNSFRKSRIDVAPFSMAVLICLSVTCLQIHTYMALDRCVVSIGRKLSKSQIRMIINKSIDCILLTLEAGPPSPAAINHTKGSGILSVQQESRRPLPAFSLSLQYPPLRHDSGNPAIYPPCLLGSLGNNSYKSFWLGFEPHFSAMVLIQTWKISIDVIPFHHAEKRPEYNL